MTRNNDYNNQNDNTQRLRSVKFNQEIANEFSENMKKAEANTNEVPLQTENSYRNIDNINDSCLDNETQNKNDWP